MGESTSSGWENRAHLPVFWGKPGRTNATVRKTIIYLRKRNGVFAKSYSNQILHYPLSIKPWKHNFSVNWSMMIGSVSVLFFLRTCPGAEPTLWPVRKSARSTEQQQDHSSKLFEWENTKCGMAVRNCIVVHSVTVRNAFAVSEQVQKNAKICRAVKL